MRIENLEETYLDRELRKQLQQGYVDATRSDYDRYLDGALDQYMVDHTIVKSRAG